MSPNAAPNAVKKESQSATETVATALVLHAKCSLLYAPIVAKKLKYRSNHARKDLCIAAIATVKQDPADNTSLALRHTRARFPGPCMSLQPMEHPQY